MSPDPPDGGSNVVGIVVAEGLVGLGDAGFESGRGKEAGSGAGRRGTRTLARRASRSVAGTTKPVGDLRRERASREAGRKIVWSTSRVRREWIWMV